MSPGRKMSWPGKERVRTFTAPPRTNTGRRYSRRVSSGCTLTKQSGSVVAMERGRGVVAAGSSLQVNCSRWLAPNRTSPLVGSVPVADGM
ncbi:MAG: hypothetical protein CM1200mP2_09520 [Planctomycetaceae bacterium]|nr:MAG: hypothetical protein CM1200mP2_09520 [Planctomycetaceae bacterium]